MGNEGRDLASAERAEDAARLQRLAAGVEARIDGLLRAANDARSPVERVRRRHALAAALAVADNAQSPVIHETGAWDYRRDRHHDGARWEQAWLGEMLGADAEGRAALLTNCGMAAITTVLAFVERSSDGPIVLDANVYHETRHLLLGGSLRHRCHIVPSDDVVDVASRIGASVVFVDAVSNTRDVRIADLAALAALSTTLVVDTSVCTMTAALVAPLFDGAASVVLVESLTKHAQLGLDRVPAGVIVADEANARRIDALREHLGTNITDIACMLLPAPDRVALRQRLDRIARNASLWAAAPALEGVGVRHPSLPSHPDHDRWRTTQPSCGLMTCRAAAPIERWLIRARDARLPLDHGAGFAFDVSRVYRTTRTVPEADAFVRIAPGTEPVDVTEALIAAISAP